MMKFVRLIIDLCIMLTAPARDCQVGQGWSGEGRGMGGWGVLHLAIAQAHIHIGRLVLQLTNLAGDAAQVVLETNQTVQKSDREKECVSNLSNRNKLN